MPIVLVGRPPKGSRVSYVDADNRQGAQSAVAHLIDSGRRVIATITGVLDTAPGIDRRQGYRDALIEAGLKPDRSLEALGEFTREGASAAMTHLLHAHPEIDGVFAASDQMAAARHGRHPGLRPTGARRCGGGRIRRPGHRHLDDPAIDKRPPADRGDGS